MKGRAVRVRGAATMPDTPSNWTLRVVGRRVPDMGACPECRSLDVGIVGRCEEDDADNWLAFDCRACKHSFKMTGLSVRMALCVLHETDPPPQENSN